VTRLTTAEMRSWRFRGSGFRSGLYSPSCGPAPLGGIHGSECDPFVKGGVLMRSEQLIRALALIGATAGCGVGCVAHAAAGGAMEAEAPVVLVEPPTLVEVDADVWVVRDYDYSVYYTGGFYWVYRDGIWWRSEMYDKGWAKVEVTVVPQVIVQ